MGIGRRLIVGSLTEEACCWRCKDNDRVNRKLYIVDAQPRADALANGAKGGGSESSSNYPKSEVLFLGIQNIHTMRDSLSRPRDYVDAHGSISSNGSSSAVPLVGDWRNRGPNWGGGSLNSMTQFSSMLVEWLNHIQNILIGASRIDAQIAQEYIITKTSKNGLMLPFNLIGIYWWRCGTQENIIDWILWASCQKSSRVKLFVLLFCLFFLERLIFYAHLCKKLPLEVSDRRLCRKL